MSNSGVKYTTEYNFLPISPQQPQYRESSAQKPISGMQQQTTYYIPVSPYNTNGIDMSPQPPQYQVISQRIIDHSPLRSRSPISKVDLVNPIIDFIKPIKLSLPELQIRFVLAYAEIDRLTTTNSLANREIEFWKEKCRGYEKDGRPRIQDGEAALLKVRNAELEGNLEILAQEIQRLQGLGDAANMLVEKDKEIQKLKNRVEELEGIYKHEMDQLSNTIEGQEIVINKLKNENERLVQTSVPLSSVEELKKIRIDLERKLVQVSTENERVNNLLVKKVKEYDDLQAKLLTMKVENDKLNQLLNDKGDTDKLKSIVNDKDKEILLLKAKCQELEGRYGGAMAECEKLNAILKQKNELELSTIKALQDKLKASEDKNNALQLELIKADLLKKDKEALEAQLNGANQKIRDLEGFISKLQDQLRQASGLDFAAKQLQAKVNELEDKNKLASTENQRLNDELRKKGDAENQLKASQLKNKENEAKIGILNNEIERLNGLTTKKAELDSINQALKMKVKEYEERVSNIEKAHAENAEKMAILQGENTRLLIEIDKLKRALADLTAKEEELEAWKQKHDELEKKAKKDLENQKSQLENHHNNRMDNQKKAAAAQLTSKDDIIKDLEARLAQALDDLKKRDSRIKELEDLVAKLQYENQKVPILMQDVENWKIQYANLEKNSKEELMQLKQKLEAFLALKLQEERAAYDIKFKAMQDDFDVKMRGLQAENKKLLAELDQLKSRVPSIKQEGRKEAENMLKPQYEGQIRDLKVLIDRERNDNENLVKQLRENINDLENKNKALLQELDRLKKILLDRDSEINRLKRYEQLESINQNLLQQIDQLKNRINDLEKELAKSMDEIKRLTNILEQKDNEIMELKEICEQAKNNAEEYITKTLEEISIEIKNRLEREKAEFKAQIAKERAEIDAQTKIMNQNITEYEKRIAHLINENETLSAALNDTKSEIENWRIKYNNLDRSRLSEIEELKHQLESLKKKLEQDMMVKFNEKILEYQETIKKLNQTIQDFDIRQILYFIEIERRLLITQELTDQLYLYQDNYNNLLNGYNELEEEFKVKTEMYEKRIRDLEKRDAELDSIIQKLMADNSRLSDLSVERLKEIDTLKVKYNEEVELDKNIVEQLETCKRQLSDAKNQLSLKDGERRNLELQIQRLGQAYEASQNEINRLANLLEQRRQEYENLAQRMEEMRSGMSGVKGLEKEHRLLEEKYREAMKEIENMQKTRDLYKTELEKYTRKDKDMMNDYMSRKQRTNFF